MELRMKKAVILLSGGLDSTTVAAIAKSQGYELYALSIDYGQRHRIELESARHIATALSVKQHRIVSIDLRAIGGSALTDAIDVPKDRSNETMSVGVPVTYVPARNTILLGLALGYAETVGAFDLFIGANHIDYSGYPDCRPAFIEAFERLANLATKAATEGQGTFRVHSPLLQMSKVEIIREGVRLGVDYSVTLSCYDPDAEGRACGRCDSCLLRIAGFADAGVIDPTRYVPGYVNSKREIPKMRKQIVERNPGSVPWLDLVSIARVEITSEDPAHPFESALTGTGWRASGPGEQVIRLIFDTPMRLRRVRLVFREESVARTQEFVLRWASPGEASYRDIVRQQYNFTPPGTTLEEEEYTMDLLTVAILELRIVPNISGGDARASLAEIRLASD